MRTLLLAAGLAFACLASVSNPLAGILAYMANYLVAPEFQWWGQPLSEMGVRSSLLLALASALGLGLRWGEIRAKIVGPGMHSQEYLVCAFTALVLLSRVWGVPIDNSIRDLSATSQMPSSKMPKVLIFLMILTHAAVRYKDVRQVWWLLILVGGLYTGIDAYTAIDSRFVHGRLDLVGGADFRESNMGAAHLALVCVLIGAQFLKSRRWQAKAACVASGAFSVNAIIMTQCRSALVGLGVASLVAPLMAPRGHKFKMVAYVALGVAMACMLTNKSFWDRAETISADPQEKSAASRFDLWKAGMGMFADNPLGVGAGSFYTVVGRYNPDYRGRDCHNTFVRCLAELGLPGAVLLALLIANAFRTLARAPRLAADPEVAREIAWDSFGLGVGLVAYLVSGTFIGLTYIEELWWFLCLPVCLERAALASGARDDDPTESRAGG